ncbi:hypothetical protein [Chelativorans salis]|uniref:Uncharacterized protein n=1 Tax=Chelativorans salis TaxID=2978478 RepID=A0ABT2LI31_9HYPH|nr:hypothetical protein [Chelativorans sp. EGI FJ00035]MCT7373437.1 hypothetical protein [Chelativorans sp. EGI FJ00035]
MSKSDTPKDKDHEKGDEILRRLLKTPPDPKGGKKKGDDRSRRPHSKEDRENGRNAK